MMKMESTKSRRLRWLDCILGPMKSNSKWLQENLEDQINESVGRKLKMIEDSDADADSFAEKVEMYNESRQELNNLVDKCYNHGRGELILNNIPNSGRDISISNVSSGIRESRPLLSKLFSSKQTNAPACSVVSKHLKQSLSSIESKNNRAGLLPPRRPPIHNCLQLLPPRRPPIELSVVWSDELEADLHDMIEKLYIQMEWDRVVSMLQHRILRPYEDDGQVKESVSSNVDKALLEETLELHGEICRHLNEMSYLEEYNEEINTTNL